MLYLVLFLTILTVGLITSSIAAIIFSIIIIAIGLTYAKKTKVGYPKDATTVFLVSFIVFSILALIRVLDLGIADGEYDTLFKSGGDEDDFWEKSQIAAKQSSFYDAVPNITNTLLRSFVGPPITIIAAPGYHMYIGLIGFVANHFFDGNVIILQLLGSCLFGCLLAITLYKILAMYLPSFKAKSYSLYGVLLTAYIYYSVSLLRDIHITFFFALVLYIIIKPYSWKNLSRLLLIILVTASFRVWSAIFLSIFILYYLFSRFKDNKAVLAIFTVLVLSLIVLTALPLIDGAIERLIIATRNVESKTVEQSGYLQLIYILPMPIKEVAIILSSYLTPFMAWKELGLSNNIYHTIIKFTIVVYEFYWFIVIWLTAKWCVFNKGLKKLPNQLMWLLIIVIAYLFISTSEFSVRRTMCMYPIIFLIFVYLKEFVVNYKCFRRDLYLPLSFYMLGTILFVIISIK